ncbi:methyltransferase domain-containing protein [Rickettsiales bacterium]|nr:methyltransferase domain-containing protein [Rickettsiales bacterium]
MNLTKKKLIANSFNRATKSYDENAFLQRKISENLFELIKSDIDKNHIILDGGCGTGYFHELLRKNRLYSTIIQCDIAKKMCDIAHLYASPAEYGLTYTINADLEYLPFKNDSIDLFFSSMTMQWCSDLEKTINLIHKILKPSGKVAIAITAENSLYELTSSFAKIDSLYHTNEFVKQEYVKNIVEKNGFKNISINKNTETYYYDDIYELLGSIKNIGGNYVKNRNKSYPGKNYFNKLENQYRKLHSQNGEKLPLSWEILYITAEK